MTERSPCVPGAPLAGGRYRLMRRLASGGMADVWVARNEVTAANVAVKLCAGDRPDACERMRHEARLGAMLAHRNIVRVYDLLEEPDGMLALLMELLRGETLGQYMKTHAPLAANEALAVVLPVLSALDHAHALGVIHRDVTPENVFLAVDPDGVVTPKLVDFGIAKLPADTASTLEGHVLGTPRYMAPERIRGGNESADARGDLFSVGAILCEALTGVSPFAAQTPAGSLAAVLERHVDPDPRVDAALWVEVERAMAKEPYARHRNAREMAESLLSATNTTEAGLGGALRLTPPIEPPVPPAFELPAGTTAPGPARLWRERRFRLLAALVVVALIGVSLGIVGREHRGAASVATSSRQEDVATAMPPTPLEASSPAAPATSVAPHPALSAAPGDRPRPMTTDTPPPPPEPAAPRPRPAPPAPSRRPRGIATTPGF